jgi:hypothetical protein
MHKNELHDADPDVSLSIALVCLQGTAGLIMGWASGRFGILGIHPQKVENQAMNIIGLCACVCSMGIMFLVKTVKAEAETASPPDPTRRPLPDDSPSISTSGLLETGDAYLLKHRPGPSYVNSPTPSPSDSEKLQQVAGANWSDQLQPTTKRILGITLAIIAGCLYGLNFNPPQYLIDSGRGASSHGIDYVFSHFTGILTTSTAYLIVYAIYKRNAPQVSGQILLPGIASGIGWACAQISWFVANDQIHFVGTFPLVSCGPGIVATLCAIIFFKEIQGKKNFAMLGLAAVVRAHTKQTRHEGCISTILISSLLLSWCWPDCR